MILNIHLEQDAVTQNFSLVSKIFLKSVTKTIKKIDKEIGNGH